MPRKSHHRSRSSIDRVLDLLSELDETQMELLLREAESTVTGNIPVSKGIDFFERPPAAVAPTPPQPQPAPRRKFLTSLSPRKQTELRRRQSKRSSTQQDATTMGESAPRVSLSLSSPPSSKKTPRSYKRISRPVFSLPTPAATADLSELLAAYLVDAASLSSTAPSSPSTSSALSSPTTPRSIFSPYGASDSENPGMDLLEPSPARAIRSGDIFGGPVKGPTRKISGIFEVLDDARMSPDRL